VDDLKGLLDEKGIESATLARLYGTGAETVYAVTRPGAEAVAAWRALRDALAGRGWWPVILGAEEGIRRIGEDLEFNLEGTSPRAVVEKGLALSPEAWLAERGAGEDGPDESEWSDEIEIAPNHTFGVARDVLSGEPFASVAIALVPAVATWEVPAYLGIGGWNDCPNPEAHVALMRRWHERHGAAAAPAATSSRSRGSRRRSRLARAGPCSRRTWRRGLAGGARRGAPASGERRRPSGARRR
jgi:Domain of unknown function (DUF4253)